MNCLKNLTITAERCCQQLRRLEEAIRKNAWVDNTK
jgi:hypothetical protein